MKAIFSETNGKEYTFRLAGETTIDRFEESLANAVSCDTLGAVYGCLCDIITNRSDFVIINSLAPVEFVGTFNEKTAP